MLNNMEITIKLFGFLNSQFSKESMQNDKYETKEQMITITYLLKQVLCLTVDEVIILVNDKVVSHEEIIRDGDSVKIFPPIAGG
jgi:molybdopterin converting factor small subunit